MSNAATLLGVYTRTCRQQPTTIRDNKHPKRGTKLHERTQHYEYLSPVGYNWGYEFLFIAENCNKIAPLNCLGPTMLVLFGQPASCFKPNTVIITQYYNCGRIPAWSVLPTSSRRKVGRCKCVNIQSRKVWGRCL